MIDFSEIEPYYGPLAVEDLDAAVAAVQNADSTPDATHENALITSAGVANALGAMIKNFTLNAGETLTITTPQNSNGLYAMLVATSGGSGGTHNGCFYLSGFSNSNAATYKNVTTIQAATNIVVTAYNANFTIANTHGSYRCQCGVVIITDAAGILTFSVS